MPYFPVCDYLTWQTKFCDYLQSIMGPKHRKMYYIPILIVLFSTIQANQMDNDLTGVYESSHGVKINKCCENDQLMVDLSCISKDNVNQSKY